MHKHLTENNDYEYKENTKDIKEKLRIALPLSATKQEQKDILLRVMECGEYWEMVKLQEEISNLYDLH